ncbi:MAG TPA: DNA-binding protein [Oscillospiraceae bacterium]|nr:DNA-binding protein [Oscillospiraceae bacterium]
MPLTLGLDTSNYTTSAAVFDGEAGRNAGRLLPVEHGALGLRQSDALFAHVKALPDVFLSLAPGAPDAVGASVRPRGVPGSYMPCFLAGESQGRVLAAALGVPFFAFSHQEGHLAAAAFSAGHMELLDAPFLAWHLSGGTTELLYAEPSGASIAARRIGGTGDLSAGQLVDRTGLRLGLPFPAGKALDALAAASDKENSFAVKLRGLDFSLSGMENKAAALAAENGADAARFVFLTLADVLARATAAARRAYGELPVLFAGGVASSGVLRARLRGDAFYFAAPRYSTDNALGVAILTYRRLGHGT